ncbi:uncharacterized protein LOC141685968 [Apium graveolens]|uniref:uncharacterized protein LOC141685968 n=1 Tax=Apium graveolens TaxID=4045 RepID=UPI003D79DFC0
MNTDADAAGPSGHALQQTVQKKIDELLRSIGKCLKKYDQLPQPPATYLNNGTNNLILEETSYNMVEMEREHSKLLQACTEQQMSVYDVLMGTVHGGSGGLFFVYASFGIAATLMPGGRTAHSRFKIPILLDEFSTYNIAHDSDIAQLIKQTDLIIWDEAPMQHRFAFECLDRSLRDIMKAVDPSRFDMPFGGITVILGGYFRQILPVITFGSRADIVAACITRSRLWQLCNIYVLTENMRLRQGSTDLEIEDLKWFTQWVLYIGNGNVLPPRVTDMPYMENRILIPPRFCDLNMENSIENMISIIFPGFLESCRDPEYLSKRAVLTPTNQTVGHLNSLIVDMVPGDSISYFSVDSAEEFGGTNEDLNIAFPVEYLNSLNVAGMPPHDLKLKVVMW